ncbi:MAG: transposase [Myxococcota bacterium]
MGRVRAARRLNSGLSSAPPVRVPVPFPVPTGGAGSGWRSSSAPGCLDRSGPHGRGRWLDGLGNPTKIALTEGQVHDVTQALEMLKEATSRSALADKAYDESAVVSAIESNGSIAVIPSRRGRIERSHDRQLFRSRFLVEHFFARIKRCRRIATRYGKLAVTYLAMVLLAYRIALRSSTECAAALHTCQRRNLAEVDGIEAGRVLLKRVAEMLTRLVLSTARRQIPDRDRKRDRDPDRGG